MLLCVALLLGRWSDAHLHLCFDGKEQTASLHVFGNGLHHDKLNLAISHQDADLAISGEILSKTKFESDLPLALLSVLFLLGLIRTLRTYSLPSIPGTFHPAQTHLLPPLRGPPLGIYLAF
jgi:hypothetical protein